VLDKLPIVVDVGVLDVLEVLEVELVQILEEVSMEEDSHIHLDLEVLWLQVLDELAVLDSHIQV